MKLLFDRADAIPLACALPVIELLDQDGAYLTLIATRPAPHADLDWGIHAAAGLIPEDQYDVIPLGHAPRSNEWKEFVLEAVGAQLPQALTPGNLPNHILEAILYYSGDSVRLALQLTHSVLSEGSGDAGSYEQALVNALYFRQTQLMNRAKARLRRWQRSFSSTRGQWRQLALGAIRSDSLRTPVQVTMTLFRDDTLWSNHHAPPSQDEQFVAACLEDSLLRPPHGEYWVPGARFTAVEISPLLLWEKHDGLTVQSSEPIDLPMSISQFQGGSRGPSKIRSGQAFVGLRFTFPSSVRFFHDLKASVANHPMLNKVRLQNGKLPSGARWAVEIREIIRRCTLLCLGDVTGGRGDVLFELGIAFGLDRPIIPVVEEAADISRCPYWLRAFNIGVYGTPGGRSELVTSIFDHLYTRRRQSKIRLPASVPHVAAFIGSGSWTEHQLNQFRRIAEQESITVEHIPMVRQSNYEDAVQLVARAAILVLTVDDTDQDAFAHFAAGVVVAHPSAGFGNRPLARQVIILPETSETGIPDSLNRAQPTVVALTDSTQFVPAVRGFIRAYVTWRSGGSDGRSSS